MKLKKLISVALSIILMLSFLSGMSFAAEETEPVYGKESVGILSALEIADISEDELSDKIKRADFLMMMSIAAGYGETKSVNQVFADLTIDDEREPYLKALYNLGMIAADSKGNIYPDTEIALKEAAAIAVKVTGHSIVAESKGGYPNGYMNVAKTNKLLEGLPTSPNKVVTKGMAVRLIMNTLKADLMLQSFGGDAAFEEAEGKNLLSGMYNVYYIHDVVNGVDVSRLAGENDIEAFYAVIGKTELEVMNIENIHEYLGYRVEAYYTVEKGDIPRLIYIEKSDKNNEIVIKIDDVENVTSGRIKAYDENTNRTKTYSYSRTLPVVYNSVSTNKPFSESMISGKSGEIRLLDNTGDRNFDVIYVDAYENYVVAHVDTENNKIYDKYNNSKQVVLDVTVDEPYTNIYDAENKAVSVSNIKKGNVVAVFKSAEDAYQQYINAYIVSESVSGVIERTKDGGKKVIIDGVEYKVSELCKTTFKNILKPGQSVKLSLDYSGIAVYAEKGIDAELNYGFIASYDAGEADEISSLLKLKLYTMNAQFEIYDLSENVKIDGAIFSDKAKALARLKAASKAMFKDAPETSASSLIRYIVNESGQISVIDTVINNVSGGVAERESVSNISDTLFYISGDNVECRNSERLGPKIIYTATTPVMAYPSPADAKYDLNDEECYFVSTSKAEFANESEYYVSAFYNDEKQYVSDFIGMVYNDNSSIAKVKYLDNIVVVSAEVSEMYDKDKNEIVDFIEVDGSIEIIADKGYAFVDDTMKITEGVPNKTYTDSTIPADGVMTLADLKLGDIIKYKTGKDGRISDLQFVFRPTTLCEVDRTAMSYAANHSQSLRYGYVYDKYDAGLVIYFPLSGTENSLSAFNSFNKADLANVKIKDCDILTSSGSPITNSFEEGRPGEMVVVSSGYENLKSYKDVGTECSRVVVQQYWGRAKVIVSF